MFLSIALDQLRIALVQTHLTAKAATLKSSAAEN